MAAQLRIYTIRDGKLDDWVALFKRSTLPMRRHAGFDVSAWAPTDDVRFVWLLSRPGSREEFLEADQAYNAAPAHAAILAEARALVEDIESFFVQSVR